MFSKISYRVKIALSFTAVFALVIAIGGMAFLRYNTQMLRLTARAGGENALAVVMARVDDRLRGMDDILKKLQVSEPFTSLVKRVRPGEGNHFDIHPTVQSELNEIFLALLVSESLSTELHYVSRYGDSARTRMAVVPYSRVENDPQVILTFDFVERALATSAYSFSLPPHDNRWINREQRVFSVVRPIRDNGNTYGLLQISQDISELDQMCKIHDYADDYAVMLYDDAGQVVYRSGEAPALAGGLSSLEQDVWTETGEGGYLLGQSAYSGWRLVFYSDFSSVAGSIARLGKSLLYMYLVACVVIIAFFFVIASGLTRPLKRLERRLSSIEAGESPSGDATGAKDEANEVAALSNRIEHILLRIRAQNELLEQTREREMRAHMRMLEAQLDPHFLYNALSVISASAYEDGSERAYRMCNQLSSLLRYTVKNENQQVRLMDELENARQYLAIMQTRYEDDVEVVWALDEAANEVVVPKLILQPLIENCFQHGFKEQPPIWRIQVRTRLDGRNWYACVINNGKPFDEREIDRINAAYRAFCAQERASTVAKEHFGLENTIKRLRLHYGEDVYFYISVNHGWTHVEIGGRCQ